MCGLFLFAFTGLWLVGSRLQTVEKSEQVDTCLAATGPRGLFSPARVGEENILSSTLLGLLLGALRIKWTQDRLTGKKGVTYAHGASQKRSGEASKRW